jgi:ankyrin repeat protein
MEQTPSHSGWTSLRVAVREGYSNIVWLILDRGADLNHSNCDGWTSLRVVVFVRHEYIFRLLLERGTDAGRPDNRGMLQRDGHDSIVRLLLNYVVDANAEDGTHRTLLFIASQFNRIAVVTTHLEQGVNVDASMSRWTTLHVSSQEGNLYGSY